MSELQDYVEAVKNHERLIQEGCKTTDEMVVATSCSAQSAFQNEQHAFLRNLLTQLAPVDGKYSADVTLQRGLSALNKLQARAFIVQNVLEAVKSGKKLTDALRHYHSIGLTDVNPDELKPTADGSQPKNGRFLLGLWDVFKKVWGIIVSIIVNAMKTSAEMVGVKPSVGLAGGFPTISFEIGPESVSFSEIWERLKAGFGVESTA